LWQSSGLELETAAAHIGRMEMRIKIRSRASPPTPWKWEIFGERLITSGHQSYATRAEAYDAGQSVLARMVASEAGEVAE
jgi:hypothetical protein